MSRKRHLIFVLGLCLVGGLALLRYTSSLMQGSGKTSDARTLRREYRKAGPRFEALYTNDFVQFLPSGGEVSWRRFSVRGSSVTITGQISPAALWRFLTNHPAIQFNESEDRKGQTEVMFRWIADVGDGEIITNLRANMTSGSLWMSSFSGISKHGNR